MPHKRDRHSHVASKAKKHTRELLFLGRLPEELIGKDLDHLSPADEKLFNAWLEMIVDAIGNNEPRARR